MRASVNVLNLYLWLYLWEQRGDIMKKRYPDARPRRDKRWGWSRTVGLLMIFGSSVVSIIVNIILTLIEDFLKTGYFEAKNVAELMSKSIRSLYETTPLKVIPNTVIYISVIILNTYLFILKVFYSTPIKITTDFLYIILKPFGFEKQSLDIKKKLDKLSFDYLGLATVKSIGFFMEKSSLFMSKLAVYLSTIVYFNRPNKKTIIDRHIALFKVFLLNYGTLVYTSIGIMMSKIQDLEFNYIVIFKDEVEDLIRALQYQNVVVMTASDIIYFLTFYTNLVIDFLISYIGLEEKINFVIKTWNALSEIISNLFNFDITDWIPWLSFEHFNRDENIDVKEKQFTTLDSIFAKMCEETYGPVKSRQKLIQNFQISYKFSNDDFSVYETSEIIVISCKGTDVAKMQDLMDNGSMVIIKLLTDNIVRLTNGLRYTIKEVDKIKRDRKMYLTGHSKGAFLISRAIDGMNMDLYGSLFALPYKILGNFKHMDDIVKNEKFKKIFYKQDLIANQILDEPFRLSAVMFDDPSKFPLDAHRISNFTKMENKKFVKSSVEAGDYTTVKSIKELIIEILNLKRSIESLA